MVKPRQRVSHPEIIIRKDLKSKPRLFVESIITVMIWIIYIYILLPFITLILWIAGIKTIYSQVIGEQGYLALFNILENAGLIIYIVFVVILGWTYYNYIWFKIRGDRRNSCCSITQDKDFSQLLKLDITVLEKAKTENRLIVDIEEEQYKIVNAKATGIQ